MRTLHSVLATLGLVVSSLAIPAQALNISGDGHRIYYGDIDSNGTTDIYFHGQDQFIPVFNADMRVPLVLSNESFVVFNNNGQYSTPQLIAPLSDADIANFTRATANRDFFSGDLNGDGNADLLVRGINSSAPALSLAGTSGVPVILQQFSPDSLSGININNRAVNIVLQDADGNGRADIVIEDNNSATANPAYLANSSGIISSRYTIIASQLVADKQPPSYSGASAGEFRVSEAGAANYTVRFTVPEGTAGVAPQLGMSYASNGNNGLLGQGWSLSGLSSISRCRKTVAVDGVAQRVQWNANDRFCLNGQRLILVSGSYGSPNSEYRTEIDSYTRVRAIGGSAGHPSYFKALRKDGSVTFYGHTSDSRQRAGSYTLSWAQSRFEDSVGNPVNYSYFNDANGHRIQTIRYAYGSGSTHNAELSFNYHARPDTISGYISGYLIKTAQRLNSVTVKNRQDGSLHTVRTYQLNYNKYDPNSIYRLSQIGNVQECVASGCLAATEFNWQQPAPMASFGGYSSVSAYDRLYDHVRARRYLDVNGDGLLDMVMLNQDDTDRYDDRHLLRYFISDGSRLVPANFSNGNHWYEFLDYTETVIDQNGGEYVYTERSAEDDQVKIDVLDYNGDGRQDLAVFKETVGYWQVHMSVPVGNNWQLSSSPINLTQLNRKAYAFLDVDADGMADAVSPSRIYYLKRSSSGTTNLPYAYTSFQAMSLPSFGTPVHCDTNDYESYGASTFEITSDTGDINGDGNVEFMARFEQHCSNRSTSSYALVEKQGSQFVIRRHFNGSAHNEDTNVPSLIDINGDGLSDILRSNGLGSHRDWYISISTGTGFLAEQHIGRYETHTAPQLVDVNNDGFQDFVYRDDNARQLKVRLYNGSGFLGARNYLAVSSNLAESHQFVDVNADNRIDHVIQTRDTIRTALASGSSQPDNTITRITNGLGAVTDLRYASITSTNAYTPVDHELSQRYYTTLGYRSVGARSSACNSVSCSNALNMSAASQRLFERLQQGDLARGIWDLPAGSQTMGSDQPILPLNSGLYVVTRVDSSAPRAHTSQPGQVDNSAKSSIAYQYAGARVQAAGRGFLGFQYLKTIDLQTNIKTTTHYRQDYPFIGSPLETVTFSPNGQIMQESSNEWRFTARNGADGTRYYQVVQRRAQELGYKVATNTSGTLTVSSAKTKYMSTTNTHDSEGNPTQIISLTRGYDASGGVNLTETKTVNNSYSGGSIVIGSWGSGVSYAALGRLTAASATTNLNGTTTTRTSSFSYIGSGAHAGLLQTETVQPGAAQNLTLTTTHSYDSFGNQIKVSARGWDGDSVINRETHSQYDPIGRYMAQSSNQFGQITSKVLARDVRGTPTRTVNLSGIETQTTFDDLGRETYRSDSTGVWASTEYLRCDSGCPAAASYGIEQQVAGGGRTVEYFDILGRKIREGSVNFGGQWVYNDIEYDSLGRVVRQSEPYFALTAPLWMNFRYDALGRSWYTQAADGSVSRTSYDGLSMTTVNAFGQQKTEVQNALEQLIEVTDHLSGRIGYSYNVDGELIQMRSYRANGSLAASTNLGYDVLGRKTSMNDPDKGNWLYNYNAFGELISQVDANGQEVVERFDVLGRMISRTDYRADNSVEGHTTWVYDNNTRQGLEADNARGQLREVVLSQSVADTSCFSASTQQCSTYYYDDFGRPITTEMKLGTGGQLGTYSTATEYDSIGRVVRNYNVMDGQVNANGSAITSGTEVSYNNYGFAYLTTDLQTGNTLQQIIARDQRGNMVEELKGNGARTYYQYDDATGRLLDQNTTVVGLFALQDIEYQWDVLGNLTYRHNQSASDDQGSQKNLRESFCYDGLNRLIKTNSDTTSASACGGLAESSQDMRYDSLGNITYKKDVGSYSYAHTYNTYAANDAGLHAVTSTSDGYTYHYDNNGNMIEDRKNGVVERSLSYTTFDKPDQITKGNHTTRFAYGYDRSRYWREDTDKDGVVTTTLYLGGTERITKSNSSNIEWKRYLGHSIVTTVTDANNNQISSKQRYVYKDHLGSTDVITNETAQIVQSMSFDPWGQRRNSGNWQPLSSLALTSFDHSESTKGYTGHEHLDEVGLIHMNGRIYDPRLARFLQADPHVQAPTDTQMLNRYSYVRNNPLNATDPSGYFLSLVVGFVAKAAFGASLLGAAVAAGVATFAQAIVQGARLRDAFKAGVISGVSAYAFGKIGEHFEQLGASNAAGFEDAADFGGNLYNFGGNLLTGGQVANQIALHGLVGGVSATLQGGKFGNGFFSAGFTKGVIGAAGFNYDNQSAGAVAARTLTATVVGGTVSEVTGGKFRNGARTAGIAHLFNGENKWFYKSTYRLLAFGGKASGRPLASRALKHFLSASGKPLLYSREQLGSSPGFAEAAQENFARLSNSVDNFAASVKEGSATFFDYTNSSIDHTGDLYYAAGTATLTSSVTVDISVQADGSVSIQGVVSHVWWDYYDWHEGGGAVLPGGITIPDDWALELHNSGEAANFYQYGVFYEEF